jgi:hypothetical protein
MWIHGRYGGWEEIELVDGFRPAKAVPIWRMSLVDEITHGGGSGRPEKIYARASSWDSAPILRSKYRHGLEALRSASKKGSFTEA